MGWIIYGIITLIVGFYLQSVSDKKVERNFIVAVIIFVAITLGLDIAEFVGFER